MLGDGAATPPPPETERWVPTAAVPEQVRELLGLWFWGNSAQELRWHNESLHLRSLATGSLTDTFELRGDRVVGTWGYHRGETLHVVRPGPGDVVDHLECATFLYTRRPYPTPTDPSETD
jgi:hypothetical protein